MGRVHIDELKPGMILAKDLVGPNGRFLLPKGTSLDDKSLRVVKIWGVTEADVQGITQEEAAAASAAVYDPDVLLEAEEYTEPFFAPVDLRQEAAFELHRLTSLRVAKKLAEGTFAPCESMGSPHGEKPELPAVPSEDVPPSASVIVKGEVELASFPDIYYRIMDVLYNPRSSAAEAADLVSKDPSLTARLLKLVNSPFYGFPSAIDAIPRAVTLVGTNELAMLAMGVAVTQYFKDVPPTLMDMKCFWKNSVAMGIIAKVLATNVVGLSSERFFVAGLLADIGRLVMLKAAPEAATRAMLVSQTELVPLAEAERAIFGYDASQVAGRLLREWQFPPSLVQSIAFHTFPDKARHRLEPSIVHLASVMAQAYGVGGHSAFPLPTVNQEAWRAAGLPVSVLATALTQTDHLARDVYQVFLGADA